MTLEKINAKEKKENEVFLSWIKSPCFQLQSHEQRTTDLELYMIAKNREIGDLEAEVNAKANRIAELEKKDEMLGDMLDLLKIDKENWFHLYSVVAELKSKNGDSK